MSRKQWRRTATGLGFLAPNIVGVLLFTIFPVVFSLIMAFSNWDLTRQNMFLEESIQFVGLDNFRELLTNGKFTHFLGNTLFFMMGIPFAVGGSLLAAIMLSKDTRAGGGRAYLWLLGGAGLVGACALLAALGLGATGMALLLVSVAVGIMFAGVTGGNTVYRTIFYTPHFVAGVATFILWKKLYGSQTGPINQALRPVLDGVGETVNVLPAWLVGGLMWIGFAVMLGLVWWCSGWLRRMRADGEVGVLAAAISGLLLILPIVVALLLEPYRRAGVGSGGGGGGGVGVAGDPLFHQPRPVWVRGDAGRRQRAGGVPVRDGRPVHRVGAFGGRPPPAGDGVGRVGAAALVDRRGLGQAGVDDHGLLGGDRQQQYAALPRGTL